MTNGIFVGLSTIDVVYGVAEFPAANAKVAASSQEVFVGGPATNASIAFGHLGGRPTLVTTVGRHALATVVREELERYSVHLVDLNPKFDDVPVISSISINRTGERNIVSANAARINTLPAQIDEGVLKNASVLLVDGHYMHACQAWARAAHARGKQVVLDGGSWKSGTEELLKSVRAVICSADFLPPGCSTEDDVLEYLKDCGVRNIAITKGAESLRFVSDVTSGIVEVPNVHVVDTMGAGDIFHGAFCYYISIEHGFVEALGEATRVAAQSCRFHGTREWMKHYSRESPSATRSNIRSITKHQGETKAEKRIVEVIQQPREAAITHGNLGPNLETVIRLGTTSERQKMDRRMWIATAALVCLGVSPALEGTAGFLEKMDEKIRQRREAIDRQAELHELLTCYLYPSNPGGRLEARVPLVPAMQDPWGPPKRHFSGSGNAVAAAYALAFRPWNDRQIVQEIDVEDDDAPVLIASHLVSEPAARYFGNPKSLRPIHEAHYHDSGGGFKAKLRWAIYTPEGAKVVSKRELFQGAPMVRMEPVHNVSDLDNPKLLQPVFTRQGEIDYQLDDYLLISVLPRDSRFDRRMISFAGLHKPGTLAAEEFLSDPNQALKILRAIHDKVGGVPYYQALLSVKVDHTAGYPRPTHLELRDAQAIKGVARLK